MKLADFTDQEVRTLRGAIKGLVEGRKAEGLRSPGVDPAPAQRQSQDMVLIAPGAWD